MNKYEFSKLSVGEIVQKTLRTLKCCHTDEDKSFIITLGKDRIKQYVRNGNVLLKNVFKYIKGDIKSINSQKYIISRLKRSEMNVLIYRQFAKFSPITFLQGLNKFDKDKYAPDIEIHLARDFEIFNTERPGEENDNNLLLKGHHIFLTYGVKRLNKRALKRINNFKSQVAHIHVCVPDDTAASKRLIREIYESGADLIRIGVTNEYLEGQILGYKNNYKRLLQTDSGFYKDYKKEENMNIFETPARELVKNELGLTDSIEINTVMEALGDFRITHSMLAIGGLKDYYSFLEGEPCDMDKIIGREAHVKFYKALESLGASRIKYEILKYENLLVDYKCELNGSEKFMGYLKGGGLESRSYQPGVHVFEIKASIIINSRIIEQLARLKQKYQNVHLVVMRTAIVHDAIYDVLSQLGIDIIYFNETKAGILKDLNSLKLNYENIFARLKNEEHELYSSRLEKSGFKYDKDTFIEIFGKIKLDNYLASGIDINDFHAFYFKDLKKKAPEKALRNKIHFAQLSENLARKLIQIGGGEIQVQHVKDPNASEKCNLSAIFQSKSVGVVKVIEEGKELTAQLEKGNHIFLPTLKNGLSGEMLIRVHEVIEKYDYIHVVIHNETFADSSLSRQIYQANDEKSGKCVDILVLDTTPESLRNQSIDLGREYVRKVPKSK